LERRRRHGRTHARVDERFRTIARTFTEIEERVDRALDQVRPVIARDGGDVFLVRVEDDVAYVQMIGACGGCAAAQMTLKQGIQVAVTAAVPEIRAVEAV
jgi:Fe-S cluster biogenesis protein NfuA